MLLLFPQTQLNQLPFCGNAWEEKNKNKKMDHSCGWLHFQSAGGILFPAHSHFITYLQFVRSTLQTGKDEEAMG